mgnify:CR=1 FL=1
MKLLSFFLIFFLVFASIFFVKNTHAESTPSFEKGHAQFGVELGYGAGLNLPTRRDRTDIQFFHFAANYQYNLTGDIGKLFYKGNLYWLTELNANFLHNPEFGSLIGISPAIFQYKFLKPNRKWTPTLLGGAGISLTDWDEKNLAEKEIGGDFQFLLHFGVGLEFFRLKGESFSINYRFLHVSNAGTKRPNIGLNANLFTIGFKF